MPYLYVLRNNKGKHYTGITELSPHERVVRHNKGDVRSTRSGRPWELIHSEEYPTMEEARTREKQIKNWKGGAALKKLLSGAAGSSNGRTHASGACYLGSNPSPAASEGSLEKLADEFSVAAYIV